MTYHRITSTKIFARRATRSVPAINHEMRSRGLTMASLISENYQGPVPLSDDPSRKVLRPISMMASLRKSVLSWCRRFALLSVPREMCSFYHRIALQKRTGPILMYRDVRQSLRHLELCDQPAEPPCSYGIRALAKDRPWLTIADCELFLQGWFQSEQYRTRMGNQPDIWEQR